MAVTIKSSILNYDGVTALTGEVSIPDGTSVINGAGSGTSVTFGARLSCSFTFSDTITPGIYEVRYVKADDTVWASGLVWIEAASGTYYVNDLARLAVYQQRLAVNLESPERSTADTLPIEFEWPISGATFANSATTCKRRFLGETGAQEEALSGAISAISGRPGWYKIAYAIADRAADGVIVIPTSVTYTLVDDAGNTGYLTLVIVENAVSVLQGGTTFDQAPVTPTGRLRQIVIGDDYLATNGRSFKWTVPAVPNMTVGSVVAKFGASAVLPCGTYSFLVSGAATDNGDGTWEVSVDLPGSATANLLPGAYDWSMTLVANGINITKIQNLTESERVKLYASPS